MRMNLKRRLAPCAPPGVDLGQELSWLACGGIVSLLYSFQFFIRYAKHYEQLFLWDGISRVLDTSAVMPDFVDILGGSLSGFQVLALSMVALAVYHYAYHFQGSKSIYLMKRFPDRWELLRRCITLPLLGALACLCASALVLLTYYAIYMTFTPPACLAPGQWQRIWSLLPGVPV